MTHMLQVLDEQANERQRRNARLATIAAEMEQGFQSVDTEQMHVDADALLCEAVALIGTPDAARIVAAFNALERWYS